MNSLEKKIEKIREDIVANEKAWKEQEESMKQQFNQALGVYVGRKRTLEEVLSSLLEDDEKNEETENVPEITESQEENMPKDQ